MTTFDVDLGGLATLKEELADIESDLEDGQGTTYFVGTAVEYAVFLEFGTSKMDPKPFFRPALQEVRARGVDGFINAHTKTTVEALGSIRQIVAALAFAIERRIKEIITAKGLVDTGTLRASVLALPLADVSELPDVDDFSGFDAENPAPATAGRALVSTDIEVDL